MWKTTFYVASCRKIDYNYVMDTTIENDCLTAIENTNNRLTAAKLVFKCGVRADLKGCQCLIDAVIIFGSDLCSNFCRIYNIIGKIRGLRQKAVMREISYAIYHAYDLKARLSKMIGVSVKDMHSGLVISYLGRLFDMPELSAADDDDNEKND